jgi:SAM-dependent methyltransferase
MKDIPSARSAEELLTMARSFMQSRMIITGAELDLFTRIAPAPLSAQEIAKEVGGLLRPVTILLDALSAMGILVKEEERYQTAPAMVPLLTADSPSTVLPIIQHSGHMWRRWSAMTEIVRGTAAPGRPIADERQEGERLRAFIGAMHVIGVKMADAIVAAIDPGEARSLLDVGGGPATYTLAFLRAAPGLRATLFDHPEVIELARARVREAGLLDRVTLAAGDFYRDELPTGCDLALLSAIIHQNSLEQNVDLYRKIHRALLPGGRLVIRDHVMRPGRTRPVAGALFAVNMLVSTEGGGTYLFEEIEAGLREAGFERVRLIQEGERMDGLVEAFKG